MFYFIYIIIFAPPILQLFDPFTAPGNNMAAFLSLWMEI